jgi:Protein of unknown function (DUF3102)
MTGRAITKIDASNSLADLAARISTEHRACQHAIKRALAHAVACGRLLIEAKDQLEHGQWLPWLRDHCGVPERSAQRYITLAAHAAECKSARLADLASAAAAEPVEAPTDLMCRALEQVFQPRRDADVQAWIDQLDACDVEPFCSQDFYSSDGHLRRDLPPNHVAIRIMSMVDLPFTASWCLSVAPVGGDIPILRLCPAADLVAAIKALGPIGMSKHKLPFDFATFATMRAMQNAIAIVQVRMMRMVGGMLNELERRETISEEQYAREWNETHQQVMARLDQKEAAA